MLSNLEHAEEFVLQGWALHEGDPSITVSVDIHINGLFVARIPAGTFRSDLKASGLGSGHHAFFFNPLEYLTRRENLIEVRESASAALLTSGSRLVKTELSTNRDAHHAAYARSQRHWLNPPADANPESEFAFLSHLELAVHFHPHLRILEVGAGRGNLLDLLLQREKYFGSYLGLDLARAQVDFLRSRFSDDRVRFLTGDAARYPLASRFDLIIASSLCGDLFPSFSPILQNTCRALAPGGIVAFDLPIQDDRTSISRAEWRNRGWFRLYSEQELRRLLTAAGLELLQLQTYTKTENEHRVFVSALKLQPRAKTLLESV